MTVEPGWQLAVALCVLVTLGTVVAALGRLPVVRSIPWAALRASVQLVAVSLVVGVALSNPAWAVLFVSLMFVIGVVATSRRSGLRDLRAWAAAGVAMLSGALPVLLVIFVSGAAPFTGPAIVPLAGIVVGNMMTAHTLVARRAFADLRGGLDQYEAYLSVGFERSFAIGSVVSPSLHEALIPAQDQTRTVGLVTLPGAYIGVLLGGGSPWAAAAAQVLVLVGMNAGQTCTVVTARWLMQRGWLLPPDLRARLRP